MSSLVKKVHQSIQDAGIIHPENIPDYAKNNPEFEKVLDGARLLFGGIKDIHSKKGLEEITSRYINHKERLKSIGPKYE